MIETFRTGSAPVVSMPSSAWPDSWYAVRRFSSGVIMILRAVPSTMPLERVREVDALHAVMVTTGGQQGGFVDEVLELGADHAGGRRRDVVEGHRVGERDMARVHLEDASPAFPVGRVHDDASIESPRPQQCRVEDLGPVGGGEHDHTLVAGEAVHLGEDLIERLLALVVTAEVDRAAAGAADGVELVDEDDRRRDLLGLLEQVADTARTDADDHLDELRRRDRQERHRGLAGDRACEQRLAGTRRAGEEHTAWDLRAEPSEPIRISEELDDLHDLGLDLVDPGDVLEGRPTARFRLVQARP